MRAHLIMAGAAGALTLSACGPGLEVRAAAVPKASLPEFHTFRIQDQPVYLGGVPIGANHPVQAGTMTNSTLRRSIVASLERRGYVPADSNADVDVAYYLALPAVGDATDWDYGYLWRPGWTREPGPGAVALTPTEYRDGALVIDIIDARTHELLWRGNALADAPDDAFRYDRNLNQSVTAILGKLPSPPIAVKS
jgi:Domain of unknown function (DUF4136)